MRIKYFILSFALFFVGFQGDSFAQKYSPCTDSTVHSLLVHKNTEWETKGYQLHTNHEVLMSNGGYTPFIIQVQKGKKYVVNFIPHPLAKNIFVNIADQDKKEIKKAKAYKNQEVSLEFTAQYDGTYYILTKQKIRKSKTVCGGFSILVSE